MSDCSVIWCSSLRWLSSVIVVESYATQLVESWRGADYAPRTVTRDDLTPAGEIAQRIADVMIEGFDRHYRLFRATSAGAKERFEVADWAGGAAGGAGADPLLRRARAGVRRAAARRSSTPARSTTRSGAGEAALHRPARRPQAARARRDVLQLGRHAGAAADVRPQRLHVRARRGLDRVHRVGPADLPELLPRRARPARRRCSTPSPTSAGAGRSPNLERDVDFVLRALLEHFDGELAGARARTTSCRCSARPSTATRPRT